MIGLSVRPAEASTYAEELERRGVPVSDDADAVLADPDRIAELDFSRVRWVQSTWAGVDRVDWSSVPEDVTVTGLPGVFGRQMAEYVLGHLLARTQRIPERYATRTWDTTPPGSLAGSRLGVLGAGSIGRAPATGRRTPGSRVP